MIHWIHINFLKQQTCILTRKPEWVNDFSPTANVSQAEAIIGLEAVVRPTRAMPGPKNPIDCTQWTDQLLIF